HLWLADNVALYDRLGRDFTLLALDGAPDTAALAAAAAARNVPLTVVRIAHADARELYAASLGLIRPDQHVAWRGTPVPADPAGLMDLVTGRAQTERERSA